MSFQDDTTTTNAGQAAMICELQQDLLMAAQVGQQLLEENVRLKEDLAAVNKRYVDVKNEHSLERERTDDYRALMEGRVKQLEEELMQRTKDQLSLEDHGIAAEQSRRESVKRAEARVFELQSELAQGQEARTRLIGELRESKQAAQQAQSMLDASESTNNKLKSDLQVAQTERLALEHRCARLEEQMEQTQQDAEIFESMNAQLDQERREKEAFQFQVEEINIALSEARATVDFLQKAVQAESRVGHIPGLHEDGHSLLSEIEDRRQELESKHSSLQEKHQGLLQTHQVEQRRLKSRIQQLSQNNGSDRLESTQRQLESRLAQVLNENKQLQEQILVLKKRSDDCSCDGQGNGGGRIDSAEWEQRLRHASLGGEGALLALSQQVHDVTNELARTKRELRTATMLKASETERLYQTERKLQEAEAQLERSHRTIAQLRFQLQDPASSASSATTTTTTTTTTTPASTPAVPLQSTAKATNKENTPVIVAAVPTKAPEQAPEHVEAPSKPQLQKEQVEAPVKPKVAPMPVPQPGQPKQVVVKRENVNECAQQ